jgi:hypothetical protein
MLSGSRLRSGTASCHLSDRMEATGALPHPSLDIPKFNKGTLLSKFRCSVLLSQICGLIRSCQLDIRFGITFFGDLKLRRRALF